MPKRFMLQRLFLTFAIAISSLLLSPAPSNAVGFLISANPSMGQQLTVAPTSVSLEFSVPSIPASLSGNVIRVTDSSGTPVEVGAAKTTDSTLSVNLRDGLKVDRYQVAFRYVCDDGHVLVSAYNFNIVEMPTSNSQHPKPTTSHTASQSQPKSSASAPAVAPTPDATASQVPSNEPEVSSGPADQATATPSTPAPSAADSKSGDNLSLLAVISAFLVVVALAAVVVIRRRKKN